MSLTPAAALAVAVRTVPALTAPSGHAAGRDEQRSTPSSSPTFVPWDCQLTSTGRVCTGERHLQSDFGIIVVFGCSVPLWRTRTEGHYQIRCYDQDYTGAGRCGDGRPSCAAAQARHDSSRRRLRRRAVELR